jgi:peroxiredoxin
MDASTFGMGSRGKRYSMVVNDGVVVLRDLDRTELTMLSQVIVAAAD